MSLHHRHGPLRRNVGHRMRSRLLIGATADAGGLHGQHHKVASGSSSRPVGRGRRIFLTLNDSRHGPSVPASH